MLLYSFECSTCGEQFDELVPLGTTIAYCTKCGGEGEQILTPVPTTFRFADKSARKRSP